MSPKFFSIFSKIVVFLEKLLHEKMFQTSFLIKKGYIHFRCRTPPSLQKRLGPQKLLFCRFLRKYSFFLKILLNNKVFSTSFVIKKSYVNFWHKMPLFPKKMSKVPPKQFSQKMVNLQKIYKNR